VQKFFPEAGGSKSFPSREVRYWIKWADGLMHSGQIDSFHVLGKRALIVEYKMLPGEVPDSPRNLQLRDQAVLLKFNVPELEEIGTVVVQPLVMWLWIGGGLVVVGSILSAIPGRRRRPTDPVSSPVIGIAAPVTPRAEAEDAIGVPAARSEAEVGPLPVGAGDPS